MGGARPPDLFLFETSMTVRSEPNPLISVIIPVHNGGESLAHCLAAVSASDYSRYECLVVDDGSTDDSAEVAGRFATRVIELAHGPFGPAYARNRGAESARGDILLFIDADVMIRPDTLTKVLKRFDDRPHLAAVFGSYDDAPTGTGFLTQYKNLVHHCVHQQGREQASTFWSGCGAIQRSVFLQMDGFDEKRYTRPSIEDIDLGYRLRANGYSIMLDKEVQVTHLKQWSLRGLIQSDVVGRALPWTRLILEAKQLPDDLNLQTSQRVSALLAVGLLLFLTLTVFQRSMVFLPLLTILFLLLINSWRWPGKLAYFQMKWHSELLAYLLAGVIGALAYAQGLPGLTLSLGVLIAAIQFGRFVPQSNLEVQKALFVGTMGTLAVAVVFLLISLPLGLTAPITLALVAIVLLNARLYLFFARKRGLVFTLAVLPLQLFYYIYSVLAFVVGGVLTLWNSRLKSKHA